MSTSASVSSLSLSSRATSPSLAPSTTPPSFKRPLIGTGHTPDEVNTIPELVEYNASANGDLVFCVQGTKNGKSTYITHRQLKQAVHNCRRHLSDTIDHLQYPTQDQDGKFSKGAAVALLGDSNAVLFIHLLALVSMGIPVSLEILTNVFREMCL